MAGLFRVYARRPFLFTTPTPVSSSICHISDHWHSRLLRASRERPRGCAAEDGDELAPVAHSITIALALLRHRRDQPLEKAVDGVVVDPTHDRDKVVLRMDIDHIEPVAV